MAACSISITIGFGSSTPPKNGAPGDRKGSFLAAEVLERQGKGGVLPAMNFEVVTSVTASRPGGETFQEAETQGKATQLSALDGGDTRKDIAK